MIVDFRWLPRERFAKMYGKERRRGLSQASSRAAYIFRLHLLCNGYAPPLGRES